MCAVLRWRPSPAARRVRVFHIHGSGDRVLPAARGRPDVIVPGGGHALSVFSPAAVNDYLARVLRAVTPGLPPPDGRE
jgi:pimeloyl-ACP methyl ester carboxylesterase